MDGGALGELIKQAPYIGALVLVCGGFLYYQFKTGEAANSRAERQEERHATERSEQEERWAKRFEHMGAECHSAQDRATAGYESVSRDLRVVATEVNTLVTEIRADRRASNG